MMSSQSNSNVEERSDRPGRNRGSSLTPEEDSLPDPDDDDIDDSLPADLWFRSSRGSFRSTEHPSRLPG